MSSEPAVMEIVSGAPVLIVAFGGVKHGLGIDVPPFEFLRSLSAHGCDAVFLRDLRQAWYQFGIDGVAADIVGLAQWLRHRRRSYCRAVTVGNSMGGYASLLVGWLAGIDVAIAFSPQTTIAESDRRILGDRRWEPLIKRVHAQCVDNRYHDIRAALARPDAAQATSLLFFGEESREDAAHAMRLLDEPGCHLFGVQDSSHRVVAYIRDSGILARIFSMVSNPSVAVSTLLDDLRADGVLTAIGRTVRQQPTVGETV